MVATVGAVGDAGGEPAARAAPTTDFDKAKAFMTKLNANGLRLYPETDNLAPAFKSGEIDVGMIWLARTFMWQNAGFPVKGRFPKEGAILYVSGMVMPKNAPDKEAAYKYMNAMLEPSAQQGFAAHMGYLPTVDNAPLSGKVGEQLALPEPKPKLVTPDYPVLAKAHAGAERLVAEEHRSADEHRSASGASGSRRGSGAALVLLGPASLLMLLMLVAPLALLARDSLNRFDATELMIAAVTPENYLRFFADPFYWNVLVTTIRVSVIVTAVCLLLGLPMAWRLARTDKPVEVGTGRADGAAAVHRFHHAHRRLDDPVRARRHAGHADAAS